MSIRKSSLTKQRRVSNRKVRVSVDPTRLALSAVDRLKALLTRTGQAHKIGPATTMRELVARGNVLQQALPPSYTAAMRVATAFGDPEALLDANGMRAHTDAIKATKAGNAERYVAFAAIGERLMCFDREAPQHGDAELPVVEWYRGMAKPHARHFGEWLDEVADAREEAVEHAAVIPQGLKSLLLELGFRFDDPVVGRLETGDVKAVEELLGPEQTRAVRGEVDRVFDSSGKASLTLNLDEFTLACSLRTGIFVFEAEDVFRWMRHFRDENFFGDSPRKPAHADRSRDLRKAPRETPLVMRGMIEVSTLPAKRHSFRAASGPSASDFFLLGRTGSRSDRSPSLILHVVGGEVKTAHGLDEPLNDLYVTPDGTMWGLSLSGYAIRFAGGHARSFPLYRPTHGRTWWYGIGGAADRVLVWGAGAVLEFNGEEFVPFAPDAGLDAAESVPALSAYRREIAMLVCGDRMGAVARFDGKRWLPIPVDHVMEGMLADLDVWRGIGIVLARDGHVWRIDDGPPRPVIWDTQQQAFVTPAGTQRAMHAVRGYDGGALLASDGGVIVVGSGEPVFHSAGLLAEPTRLARVGGSPAPQSPQASRRSRPNMKRDEETVGVVAMCGPHAWLWTDGAFQVLDLRDW
jgi:hypothetical protein